MSRLPPLYDAFLELISSLCNMFLQTKSLTPFGSQKIFFDHIWKRLHPELTRDRGSSESILKKSASAQPHSSNSSEKRKSPPEDAAQDQDTRSHKKARCQYSVKARSMTMSVSDSNTSLLPLASPPIIHRSKMSSLVASQDIKARPSKKDRCMIPKKRYLYSQGNLQHRPEPSILHLHCSTIMKTLILMCL